MKIIFRRGLELSDATSIQTLRTKKISFRLCWRRYSRVFNAPVANYGGYDGTGIEPYFDPITGPHFVWDASRARYYLDYRTENLAPTGKIAFSNRLARKTFEEAAYFPCVADGNTASFVGWTLVDGLSGWSFRALANLEFSDPGIIGRNDEAMDEALVKTDETITWRRVA